MTVAAERIHVRTLTALEGRCALVVALDIGEPARNPHRPGTSDAMGWERAFLAQARAEIRTLFWPHVPHETKHETVPGPGPGPGPGRGRSRSGPRREWLQWEKAFAWACQAALTRAQIAALLPGRDAQAVRNQLCRMKRKARIRCQGSGIRLARAKG